MNLTKEKTAVNVLKTAFLGSVTPQFLRMQPLNPPKRPLIEFCHKGSFWGCLRAEKGCFQGGVWGGGVFQKTPPNRGFWGQF